MVCEFSSLEPQLSAERFAEETMRLEGQDDQDDSEGDQIPHRGGEDHRYEDLDEPQQESRHGGTHDRTASP